MSTGTVKIKLHVANLYLTLPARRVEFPMLERLSVAHCRFDNMNMVELISRCPHLRVLEVDHCWRLDTLKVHSATIEELVVDDWLTNVDIVAPVLKKFRLKSTMERCFSVSFSAPMVEYLSWSFSFHHQNVGIGDIRLWCVRGLSLQTKQRAHVLLLDIDFAHEEFLVDSDLFQQISPLPEFSVLEMYLGSYGHVFGAMMLDLLGTCNAITRLKVTMRSSPRTQACPPECLCDEFPNWRSQTIPMAVVLGASGASLRRRWCCELGGQGSLLYSSPLLTSPLLSSTSKSLSHTRYPHAVCGDGLLLIERERERESFEGIGAGQGREVVFRLNFPPERFVPSRPPRAASGRRPQPSPPRPISPPLPSAAVGAGRRAKPARCRRRRPSLTHALGWEARGSLRPAVVLPGRQGAGGGGAPRVARLGVVWWRRRRLLAAGQQGGQRRRGRRGPDPDLGLSGPHLGLGGPDLASLCSRRLVELLLLRVARTAARGLQRGHGSFTSPAGSAGPEGPGLLL
ncbi:uncharacterized protein [Lolium perenne]|uniref:uncharacterized protein n=1 Tax=Lolium perenne TaxID=4522 RepID=UPI003A9A18F3